MLQHHDLLMTIAQVAATFAGFSGIIGVFRRGASLSDSEMGALQVRAVAEMGVTVTGLALLPFVPDGFGIAEGVSWQICSGVFSASLIHGFVTAMRRVRTATGQAAVVEDPLLVRVTQIVTAVVHAMLWTSVLGIAPNTAGTRYVLALLLTQGIACFMFVRLLTPRK